MAKNENFSWNLGPKQRQRLHFLDPANWQRLQNCSSNLWQRLHILGHIGGNNSTIRDHNNGNGSTFWIQIDGNGSTFWIQIAGKGSTYRIKFGVSWCIKPPYSRPPPLAPWFSIRTPSSLFRGNNCSHNFCGNSAVSSNLLEQSTIYTSLTGPQRGPILLIG